MATARIELPPKLVPVFEGEADIRGAYGGRGSAKTRSFALMTAVRGYMWSRAGEEGVILCGREFMNSLEDSSLEEVKAAIRSCDWLNEHYEIGEKYVRTKDRRIAYTFAGLRHNLDSIKSKARIKLAWVDEAEPVSEDGWSKLIPTLREEDSELWVTWNPERKNSATHKRFREASDPRMKVVEINWRDNPWFPAILERTRLKDQAERPDSYEHVWEGGFKGITEGAYFASGLTKAKSEGRIAVLAADPLMTLRAWWDIGGTGAKADACAIWIGQYVGEQVRVLDYYEAVGQPLSAHVAWLREHGYEKALQVLPHDGATNDKVHQVSYESALRQAGFEVRVVPNMGAGAANARIEAVRRLFPQIHFNAATTEGGRDALGWYHEKRDEARGIGLGPNHDWSSHGCFHPHTEVLTRYGTHRIMDLPETGEVLTPCGWKQYVNPRITLRNAPLVEVVFKSGYSVRCTPDHLFLTVSGWKSAESLTPNTAIQSSLTKSRSISTAASIACGLASGIYRAAASAFTAMCGGLRSALSLPAVTSITGTATCSITASPTLSVCRQRFTPVTKITSTDQDRARSQERKQPNGTAPKRDDFGTAGTPSGLKAGPSGRGKKSLANTVPSRSWRWFAKAVTQANTALLHARSLLTASAGRQTNTPVVIESVRRINQRADVWDITVPDGHCFSLANGAVVHNSDAFGLMAVDHAHRPQAANSAPLKYRRLR